MLVRGSGPAHRGKPDGGGGSGGGGGGGVGAVLPQPPTFDFMQPESQCGFWRTRHLGAVPLSPQHCFGVV